MMRVNNTIMAEFCLNPSICGMQTVRWYFAATIV